MLSEVSDALALMEAGASEAKARALMFAPAASRNSITSGFSLFPAASGVGACLHIHPVYDSPSYERCRAWTGLEMRKEP